MDKIIQFLRGFKNSKIQYNFEAENFYFKKNIPLGNVKMWFLKDSSQNWWCEGKLGLY